MQTRTPRWVIERMKRVPSLYRAATRIRRAFGVVLGPRQVGGLVGRVHRNDTMFDGIDAASVDRYARRGAGTIDQFVGLAGTYVGSVEELRWMELGCGYGRLVRHLSLRVPQIAVTDVDQRGVDFCCSEFKVHGYPSDRPTDDLAFPQVDVLYAVSVISHLDLDAVDALVRLIMRTVRPGGLALVSTHGLSTLDHLDLYGPGWPVMRGEIEGQLASRRWAFLPYPGLGPAYGLAWHDPDFLTARILEMGGPLVEAVEVMPRGLEEHQDLYVVHLRPSG